MPDGGDFHALKSTGGGSGTVAPEAMVEVLAVAGYVDL